MYRFTLTLVLCCFLASFTSCSKDSDSNAQRSPEWDLVKDLSKADGVQGTYNYDFQFLKNREKLQFYCPMPIDEAMTHIPLEMSQNIGLIAPFELPFEVGVSKANIVTSWTPTHSLQFQIQISYFENKESYNSNLENFFIVSVTQYPQNPFSDMNDSDLKAIIEDGNWENRILTNEHPLFYQKKSEDLTQALQFYTYSDKENKFIKTETGAHQFYAWHNGLIYHIGYSMATTKSEPEELVREIILGGKILPELGL